MITTEVREKIDKGSKILADAVGATLGPSGRNVLLYRNGSIPHITKDGVTVAQDVHSEDPIEDMVIDILRGAAASTAKDAGDGTTTSTIIAREIVARVFDLMAKRENLNLIELKREMDIETERIAKAIRGMEMKEEELHHICMISSNGDKGMADMVSAVTAQIGASGIVNVGPSFSHKDSWEVVEGLQVDRGWTDRRFLNNPERNMISYHNPLFLLSKDGIDKPATILPALNFAMANRRPLIIISYSVEGIAREAVVMNHINNRNKEFGFAYIESPVTGQWKDDLMDDLGIALGCFPISRTGGTLGEDASADYLGNVLIGSAERVDMYKSHTVIIGPHGVEGKEEHIAELTLQLENTTDPQDIRHLESRLAKLKGNVAQILVGGNSEAEIKERLDRYDDTIHAARAALKDGIVAGGGIALLDAAVSGPEEKTDGAEIVRMACMQPAYCILKNAGKDDIFDQLKTGRPNEWYGYDARNFRLGDMREMGILDPSLVVKAALRNAVSIAGTLITTACIIKK